MREPIYRAAIGEPRGKGEWKRLERSGPEPAPLVWHAAPPETGMNAKYRALAREQSAAYDDSFARAAGHPPSAVNTVCVDLDNTIMPWGPLDEVRPPFLGVLDAMEMLRAEGYRIVILTSRLSHSWHHAEAKARGIKCREFAKSQRAITHRILDENKIPYDLVTGEKVPALVYIDDKAVRVDGVYSLYEAVTDFLDGIYR